MRSTDADGVLPEPSVHSDLGTEGAEDADIQLRKCLSGPNPLIPGPRYFCANRAIIASGSYGEFPVQHLDAVGRSSARPAAELSTAVLAQVRRASCGCTRTASKALRGHSSSTARSSA